MRKYLYLIKKKKIKSWLKFWLLTKDQVKYILSEILEGFSFNLQNTVKKRFKIFNIFGNSVQNGTPTPENPVPIHSVADDVNLLNLENIENHSVNYYYENIGTNFQLKAGETYTLSFDAESDITPFNVGIGCGSSGNYQSDILNENGFQNGRISITFTPQNSNFTYGNYLALRFVKYNNLTSYTYSAKNIKLQKGTIATPYSPYNQGTFTIDFEGQTENYNYTFITEPLRSLPNGVKDTIEDDGIHRRERKTILDENNINIVSNFGYRYEMPSVYIEKNKLGFKSGWEENICLMNKYKTINKTSLIATGTFSTNFARGYIEIFNENFTDLQTAKEILLGTEIICQLAEEIIEPFTEEQQAEYDKIKELYTFDGTTNIYSDDEVPPYLQIQYYMKGE